MPPPPMPPVAQDCDSQTVMVPSFLAPTLILPNAEGRLPAMVSSVRAVQKQLHRLAAALLREEGAHRTPGVGRELAAEPAAHVIHVRVDLGRLRHLDIGARSPPMPETFCVEGQ